MKTKHPQGQPLPPKFKARYDFQWFRTFTLKERLLILIGCNFLLKSSFYSVSTLGAVQPSFQGQVTKTATPVGQMLEAADKPVPP
jgi:hypothetical protein